MSWQPPPPPSKPQAPSPPAATKSDTHYVILQVDPDAHPTIIRYAYRFLAAMYHPDNAESGDAEKFRIISDAWRVLSDPGKRAAYDGSLGVKHAQDQKAQSGAGSTPNNPNVPKYSLSWTEVELRLAVLQVLMEARRKRPQTGGASAKMLMDCLNTSMGDMEYVLWYLREKGYLMRTEMAFMITVMGVDYLVDQLSRTQPLDGGGPRGPSVHVNLPATLI